MVIGKMRLMKEGRGGEHLSLEARIKLNNNKNFKKKEEDARIRKIWVEFSHRRIRNPYSVKLSVSLLLYFFKYRFIVN